uniref:Uncharacterized protein n=1 Tax=Candidatus Kentrum sp. SD TaxID=2126332 RepID=A0A451BMJ5_9GAMM|nr:MAG: hypothetical protein BECKSD772D_GA0070982_10524 [Candidatus Kentron sp. SD]
MHDLSQNKLRIQVTISRDPPFQSPTPASSPSLRHLFRILLPVDALLGASVFQGLGPGFCRLCSLSAGRCGPYRSRNLNKSHGGSRTTQPWRCRSPDRPLAIIPSPLTKMRKINKSPVIGGAFGRMRRHSRFSDTMASLASVRRYWQSFMGAFRQPVNGTTVYGSLLPKARRPRK